MIVKLENTVKKIKHKLGLDHSYAFVEKKVHYKLDQSDSQEKNIIFLLPDLNYPCGGNIVVHRLCEEINQSEIKGYKSYILYPKAPTFKTKWFEHTAPHKENLILNPATDFVIIPEMYAAEHGKLLKELNVPYAINVANGYLMDFEKKYSSFTYADVCSAYENANLLLAISDDAVTNIELVFPVSPSKIIKSSYVIDKAKFRPIAQKKNIITYMPRKLANHVQTLLFFLSRHLPKHWELKAIDGVKEHEVYDIFSESKIFLSFSEFEGLAMPPAMAALSGNHVIGYTGEGNKEYFNLPCFTTINCGDIKQFIQEILHTIGLMDSEKYQFDMNALEALTYMFSEDKQHQYLSSLVERIDIERKR